MITSEHYVENDGQICPFCTGEDLRETGRRDYSSPKINIEMQCQDCSFRWWDIYALTAYEPVDERDDR